MKHQIPFFILFSLCVLMTGKVSAQIPHLSPPGRLLQIVGNTEILLTYDRPQTRGREIFGHLVPWGKPWRTGAGYCTKISFDQAVRVGGQSIPAGKYALVTIPNPEEWMIILNADTTLYSAKEHNPELDVIRFRARPKHSDRFYEALTFDLDLQGENAALHISWANTDISFPITTTTEGQVMAYIDSILTAPANPAVDYGYPADFLFYARKDLNTALALTERQLQVGANGGTYNLRRMIFEYLGQPQKALAEVQAAIRFRKANPLDEQNQAWALEAWGRHLERLRNSSLDR